MNKWFCLILLLLLLTGCSPKMPSPYGEIPITDSVSMAARFPVYEKDIEGIQILIQNTGDTILNFTETWELERKQGDSWVQISFLEPPVWPEERLFLEPRETFLFTISPSLLASPLQNGTYRVIKKVSDKNTTDVLAASEFEIGPSPVSADSPYGFAPLETLSMNYSLHDAIADGAAVLLPDGTFANTDRITDFFHCFAQSLDTQIRFAYTDGAGKLILHDVILEHPCGTPRFLSRMDMRRQTDTANFIEERYYSTLTLGDSIFLCNGQDAAVSSEMLYVMSEYFASTTQFDHKEGRWVGEHTDWFSVHADYHRERGSGIRSWSPDGQRNILLHYQDFSLRCHVEILQLDGTASLYISDPLDEQVGMITNIREAVWHSNTIVMLVCENYQRGDFTYLLFDTDTQEIIRVTSSADGYRYENGIIVIPE